MSTLQNGAAIAERAKNALAKSQKPGTLKGLNSANVEDILRPYSLSIANALPNGGKPDRIIQAAVFQITTNPALAECSVPSVIGCVLNASLLGMSAALKQCFFIPYRNSNTGNTEAQFQLSYTGLITLARRSGIVRDVYSEVVRRGDEFSVQYGTDRKIVHVPSLTGGSERELLFSYAVIHYQHGGTEFVVMDRAEIEKRRKKSRGQRESPSGVWADWEAEMWKKTALRSLLKTAPLSDEQMAAMQTDGAALRPENFQRGEVRAETVVYEEEDAAPMEADDLTQIREGVSDCSDLASLEKYWQQNAEEWKTRSDVIEIFNARKLELQ